MKLQQDTSIVVRKPVAWHVRHTAAQRVLRRKGNGVYDEIERPPFPFDTREHALQFAWNSNVKRQHHVNLKGVGQRLNMFLCLFIKIGDNKIGTERTKGPGAAPRDRVFVCDANNQTSFALKKLGFRSRNKWRSVRKHLP